MEEISLRLELQQTSLSLQTKPDLNTQKGQDEVLLRHLSLARRLCCRICSCFYLPKPRNCKSIFSFWRIRITRRRTHNNRKIGGWQPPIRPWLLMKGTPSSSDEPICFYLLRVRDVNHPIAGYLKKASGCHPSLDSLFMTKEDEPIAHASYWILSFCSLLEKSSTQGRE